MRLVRLLNGHGLSWPLLQFLAVTIMIKQKNYSVYLTQTQIIPLNQFPFSLSSNQLRPVWEKFFLNKKCFTELSHIDPGQSPFLKTIGSVNFDDNNRSERIFDDPLPMRDERMYHRYLEVMHPIDIKHKETEKAPAKGRIFIHIYPSGYVILHFTISIFYTKTPKLSEIKKAITETRPWRTDNEWIWISKFGPKKLNEINDIIIQNLRKSFFKNLPQENRRSSWFTSIRFESKDTPEKIQQELLELSGSHEILEMTHKKTKIKFVLVTRQGLVCVYSPGYSRKSATSFFWKTTSIAEFVLLKKSIYDDYLVLIKNQINDLKRRRHSVKAKIMEEPNFALSVYDEMIPEFIDAMDQQINRAKPFHRKIYSTISKELLLNEKRTEVKNQLTQWLDEVEKTKTKLKILSEVTLGFIKKIITGIIPF